ncbi:MAG: 1-deoxy-D-xylulose-5-phosphate reductoisomerase [Lachnoclostridium sp.]|nr:1-deoxy-D-xylulose-5-phosphate reductoisomerase [Lachnoclostridium sp.]
MPENIAVLGSTGSIGTQTLDVIERYPELFRATVLIAGRNVDLLIEQCRKFRPSTAVIADETLYPRLREALEPLGIATAAGADAVADVMESDEFSTVVTATVGYSGLYPTIRAIRAGKRIALANKETLVVAGSLITALLRESESVILPVDSEHSAIFQCLAGEDRSRVSRLIITASGGPFRNFTRRQLEEVTVEQALHHPRWSMGAKITIDSATMINKAFEIIEARWLFGVTPEKIEAVVHPQAIVHSMVEFVDGAVKAQLGLPDMHLPIRYALAGGRRLDCDSPKLSVADYARLTFAKPDPKKFPCLTLAHRALEQGGNTACVINAANEVAVDAFLHGRIRFTDFYPLIDTALERIPHLDSPSLDDFMETDAATRVITQEIIKSWKHFS